jgi:MGT family glycosyltransferase
MARILMAVSPVRGHLNPTIAVAQRLQEAGHTVAYACHPAMGPELARAGLHLLDDFRWGDLMLEVQREMAVRKNRWAALTLGGRSLPTAIYFHRLEEGVRDLVRTLRRWEPDVVVTDLLFHAGAIAAETCALPYATFCPVILPLPSVALPPYGFGLPRGARRDWRWALAATVLWGLVHGGDRRINRIRREHGLAPVRGTFFHASPYLFLAFTTEAFEYARPDLPPQVYFVGPSITEDRGDTGAPFPWSWLDGRPLVYASLGTINTGHAGFFDRVVQASDGQPWQTVLSVGPYRDTRQWQEVPPNVLVERHVPQPALLRRASAVISHGGMNTVTETLAAGVPLAVAPAGADQPEAAQRVVEAGAGIRLKLRTAGAAELRAAIRRLLDDAALRAGARRIAADFARCDGAGTSAALILRLAERRRPLPRPPGRRPTLYRGEVGALFALEAARP